MDLKQLTITTSLTNDFRAETPVTHEGAIAAVQDEDGALELFAIGSDGAVSRFFQTADSATGWQVEPVPNTDKTSGIVGLPRGRTTGRDRLFSISTQKPPSRPDWGTWTFNEIGTADPGGFDVRRISRISVSTDPPANKMSRMAATWGAKGVSLTVKPSAPKSEQFTIFLPDDGKPEEWAPALWAEKDNAAFGITGTPAFFFVAAGAGAEQPDLPLIFTTSGNPTLGWGAPLGSNDLRYKASVTTSPPRLPGGQPEASAPAHQVVPFASRGGRQRLLALSLDQALPARTLFAISPTIPVHLDEAPKWPEAWTAIDLTTDPKKRTGPKLKHCDGILTAGGEEAVFFIDATSDSNLWVTLMENGSYVRPTRLASEVAHFCLAEDGAGNINVFAVTESHGLTHLVRRDGHWTVTPIDLPVATKATPVKLFRTSAVLHDSVERTPIGGVPVAVTSSKTIYATINGKTVCLRKNRPVTVKPNVTGRITVTQEAFGDDLTAPTLTFSTEGAANVSATANEGAVDALRSVSWQDLGNAVDPLTGKHVVKKKYRNKDDLKVLRASIQSCLSIYELREIEPQTGSPAPQCWRYDVTGERPVHEVLEPAAAATLAATLKARPAPEWELPSLDIGDAFEAVGEDFATLGQIIVSSDEVIFGFVIDGVEYVLNVDLGDAFSWALPAIGGLFGFFADDIGTGVGWLIKLTGGFTGWDDVVKVAKSLRSQLKSSAASLPSQVSEISTLKASVLSWLTETQLKIDDTITKLEAKLGVKDVSGFNPKHQTVEQMGDTGSQGTNDTVFDYLGKVVDLILGELGPLEIDYPPLMTEIGSAFDTLASEIESDLLSLAEKVVDDVKGLITSDQSFGDAAVATLLAFIRDVADTVFQLIRQLVTFFADIAKILAEGAGDLVAWLDEKLSIPFFSSMISEASDMRTSVLTVICLIVGIPMHIFVDAEADADAALGKLNEKAVWWGKLFILIGVASATTTGDNLGLDSEDVAFMAIAMAANCFAFGCGMLGAALDFGSPENTVERIFWVLVFLATPLDLFLTALEFKKDKRSIDLWRIGILSVLAIGIAIYAIVTLVDDWDKMTASERAGDFMAIFGCFATWIRILPVFSKGDEVEIVAYTAAAWVVWLAIFASHIATAVAEDEPAD